LNTARRPRAAEQANAWLDSQGRKFGHFIDGEWTAPGKTFCSGPIPPMAPIAWRQVTDGTAAGSRCKAVKAARAAFKPLERAAQAMNAASISTPSPACHPEAFSRLFAVLETMDNGKPIRESRDADIPLVARHFYHHAGWATSTSTP
jgi:aldehyde dehydrogenase (NAD+)